VIFEYYKNKIFKKIKKIIKRKKMIRKWLARQAPLFAILAVFGAVTVGVFFDDCSRVARAVMGQARAASAWVSGKDGEVPSQFGKTHFIVGQSADQRSELMAQKSGAGSRESQNSGTRRSVIKKSEIFFSPDDNVRENLVQLIEQEEEAISIAVFVFTDKQIAHHLIDAAKRGVQVEIVTDSAGLRDRYNKIGHLCDNCIPIFVYNPQHGKAGLTSLMHNKFVIFKKNKNNLSHVWTGSCNFTRAACESNQENSILLTDDVCTARFEKQFQELKKRSYKYEKHMKV
jgi:HKD family nuclease